MSTATFTPPAVTLANNGLSVVVDATWGPFAPTPSTTVVGPMRGKFANTRIAGVVSTTGQAVTIRLDYLSAAGAWVTGAKSATAADGVPQPIDWLPTSADYRLVILNGAAGPTTLTLDGFQLISDDRSSGA